MVKNMKKLLAILLAVLMIVSVTACKKNKEDENPNAEGLNDDVIVTFQGEHGVYTYEFVESSTIRIVSYSGTIELHDLDIPAEMNGNTVVAIGVGAFANSSNLKSVKVPATVTEIGAQAFAECDRLESVEIPSGIAKMGKSVFYNCDNLATVSFVGTDAAKLTEIGEGAFFACKKLTSINLPATVTTIGDGAFYNCEALASIALPASLETIGTGAFLSCTALNNVTLPATVKFVGSHAFAACAGLNAISFADAANWNVVVEGLGTEGEELEAVDVSTADKALDALTDTYFAYALKKVA